MNQANTETPAVLADFLGGLEPPEAAAEQATGKRKGKIDFAALLKADKLTEDMLDPWNEEHHEWINKVREAEAKKPVWMRLSPNDNEFFGEYLFVGVNGRDYPMPVNQWAKVPTFVLMHLQNCQNAKPIQDKDNSTLTGKFVGEIRSDRFVFRVSDTAPKLAKGEVVMDLYR